MIKYFSCKEGNIMENEIIPALTPAQPEDLDEIYALCRLAADKTDTSDWDDEYPSREILEDDISRGSLYKVVHDGKIISIMLAESWSDYHEGPDDTAWDPEIKNPCALARFCVSPLLQGHGLGRKVMSASLGLARSLGYDGVFFWASEANPLALHLYDSMGFHRAGRAKEYGCDFICYEMKL